jgi:hypothetical protein
MLLKLRGSYLRSQIRRRWSPGRVARRCQFLPRAFIVTRGSGLALLQRNRRPFMILSLNNIIKEEIKRI